MHSYKIILKYKHKIVKISSILNINELKNKKYYNEYAYYLKYDDHYLIIPCSLIYKTYYCFNKIFEKAFESSNLTSLYKKFYFDNDTIHIECSEKIFKDHIPYLCQLLLDNFYKQRVDHIIFQKMYKKSNYIKYYIPFDGIFFMSISYSEIIEKNSSKIYIAGEISRELFLDKHKKITYNYFDSKYKKDINLIKNYPKSKIEHPFLYYSFKFDCFKEIAQFNIKDILKKYPIDFEDYNITIHRDKDYYIYIIEVNNLVLIFKSQQMNRKDNYLMLINIIIKFRQFNFSSHKIRDYILNTYKCNLFYACFISSCITDRNYEYIINKIEDILQISFKK